MGKRLFLLLFASIISVINAPSILTAADTVNITGVDDGKAVETILPPEPEPVKAPVAGTVPANNIAIAGRTIGIVDVADTGAEAGNHVNKYGDRFLYGHNSAGVFGGIVNLGAGSTFSVTYAGVTTNYQVARVEIFEKNAENGLLQKDGSGNFMSAVSRAVHMGVHYDLSIMTCYGTSYGNGDASHRYVIFANAV